ncbi:hypothetical protein [Curtobacterium sp. MCPF17_031]|uniref:hypothetical protein n=1 Tax=Curtobacterium sp. MCPF17_031 TaxID=2175653 RepID=UPI0011B4406F|nr:hypothetical protein [Curtobacterium sp. MCPF17_031]
MEQQYPCCGNLQLVREFSQHHNSTTRGRLMARTARSYTITRDAEGRVLTTYSDGSYVLDWASSPLLDEADEYLVAAFDCAFNRSAAR